MLLTLLLSLLPLAICFVSCDVVGCVVVVDCGVVVVVVYSSVDVNVFCCLCLLYLLYLCVMWSLLFSLLLLVLLLFVLHMLLMLSLFSPLVLSLDFT